MIEKLKEWSLGITLAILAILAGAAVFLRGMWRERAVGRVEGAADAKREEIEGETDSQLSDRITRFK